ncbi:DctM-like transporters [Variibacter gotjawalensis]|uniref:DctM-like transporters n=2 Tax=Variibacter gotjawalensis TaxID=1333996 RepID=A0A0S3PSE2_9BRAD|nr:TRAP transporter permease [Variibacter gotjawalensis]NIK49157.1 TRAP transporter 4TM/12TM fusion protein [Variibacter gotjawalensis]RZS51013.1 TRAP transporter 4TM/12TM fusion protein [Variibacter gotjawalensis]BAT58847.1 DctM-like transporters [Variibacter gotjawalensis]
MTPSTATPASKAELEQIVAEADTGGRKLSGNTARLMTYVAIAWSLFQLWYASPLPFMVGFGVFNDTSARAIHLSFALFLAFTAYPALKSSPNTRIPITDWLLAGAAIATVMYLVVFYNALALRPGQPTTADLVISVAGVILLLEASRRAEGPWMPVISIVFLLYVFCGPYLPGLMAHKGASISRAASHFWLTSEGVFGVALGVSIAFIFLFVLFGALLEKAGAGNYFIQLAFSLLGQFRGGPAKAGVVSSGLTGMISGSSVANVVTTGTFTIPLMKRVGYTPVQAAAIECAAGVNGQLMPPVMGAAAFLMAEYVGITYADVVRHAFLPAIMTYGALFYIVDIEAAKKGMTGIARTRRRSLAQGAMKALLTFCGFVILAGLIYYGLGWTKKAFGEAASIAALATVIVGYVALVWQRARFPDLPLDDPNQSFVTVPDFYEVARTGLHFILPVSVLIWCLMVEEMSPGLAAFWGTVAMGALVLTQRPLTAFFRKHDTLGAEFREGVREFFGGLELGARNMAGVGIATAAAGIVVGTVTLTGVGLVMTELVELLSGGSFVVMLALTGLICLVLGAGLPTTASYVVVATLMAPVIVELGAQNDIAVPLIAAHMFVFYFGLMADVSPPVGLAAYAAGAIAGADPMKVGWQGMRYENRTALLPFVFIYNPAILMIDIGGPFHFIMVVTCCVLAMGAFVAASQHWLIVRNRIWETLALLLICFTLFRPGWWLDWIKPPYTEAPASQLLQEVQKLPTGGSLRVRVTAQDIRGDNVDKTFRFTIGAGNTPQERLNTAGLTVRQAGDIVMIQAIRFGSEARKFGLQQGDEIKAVVVPAERPSPYWFAIPALLLFGFIIFLQKRRQREAVAALPKLVTV